MRKQYHELTRGQLYDRLIKRKLPVTVIYSIIDRAQEKRKYMLKINRLRSQTTEPWSVLINGLLAEMNTTRAKIGYYEKNAMSAHEELYRNYLRVQQKLLPILRAYQRQGELFPIQAARRQKYEVTNDGKHWTDWVPRKVKFAFAQEQQKLPTNNMARNRAPLFDTKDYATRRAVTKEKRMNAWREERAMFDVQNAEATQAGYTEKIEYTQHVLNCIDKALEIAKDIPPHKALPKDWAALIPREDVDEVTRLGDRIVVRQ